MAKKVLYCGKCGEKVVPDCEFCVYCGARVVTAQGNTHTIESDPELNRTYIKEDTAAEACKEGSLPADVVLRDEAIPKYEVDHSPSSPGFGPLPPKGKNEEVPKLVMDDGKEEQPSLSGTEAEAPSAPESKSLTENKPSKKKTGAGKAFGVFVFIVLLGLAAVYLATESDKQQKIEVAFAAEEAKLDEEIEYVDTNASAVPYDVEFLELCNKAREDEGLEPLELDSNLNKLATQRAMETVLYYDHTRPDGRNFDTVWNDYNVDECKSTAGENLNESHSYNQELPQKPSAQKAFYALFQSKGHRENMLDKSYRYMGVARIYRIEPYRSNGEYWHWCEYVVQMFSDKPVDTSEKMELLTDKNDIIFFHEGNPLDYKVYEQFIKKHGGIVLENSHSD